MAERIARAENHDFPLAERLVSEAIRKYIDIATATALAGFGDLNDYERGARQGIDQMRHLHLAGWDYSVVPQILEELRRAGLLPPLSRTGQNGEDAP